MRVNGYRCDLCDKIVPVAGLSRDGDYPPGGWFLLIPSPYTGNDLHFCSLSHLYQWASNRLNEEEGKA